MFLLAVAQPVIPHMRERGGGSFVTLGSAGTTSGIARRDGGAVKASNEAAYVTGPRLSVSGAFGV